MNILFICGSLVPGGDGVGDYTRRLAGAMVKRGYTIQILALYDKGCIEYTAEEQVSEGIQIPVMRLPQTMADAERYSAAQQYIRQFDPVWISLQFVIFTFHKKGLPLGLTSNLKPLFKGRKIHVMFHELWVGIESDASWRHKVLGYAQKNILRYFLRSVRTDYISTHTPLYAWELKRLGFRAEILPLFGNIPVRASGNNPSDSDTVVRGLIFGNIHHGAPVDVFVQELKQTGSTMHKDVELIFIGKCGSELTHWLDACERQSIHTINKGILSEADISEELSAASFGITSTPYLLTTKSGTAAAMMEHDLRVLCVARDWEVAGFQWKDHSHTGIVPYKANQLKDFLEGAPVPHKIKFENIVDRFLNLLNL